MVLIPNGPPEPIRQGGLKMEIVEATSVEDYLNRYYKKDRMTPTLLASYEQDFKEFGYVCTSHHDNVTGEFIAWPYHPGWEV